MNTITLSMEQLSQLNNQLNEKLSKLEIIKENEINQLKLQVNYTFLHIFIVFSYIFIDFY